MAKITVMGKCINLGRFEEIRDAEDAYLCASKKYFEGVVV
jgi:hypothetical protein